MNELEKRTCQEKCEVRAVDGASPKIVGYAVLYNSPSKPLGDERRQFTEVILPGAFAGTLESRSDVRALVEHNRSLKLGRRRAGTLELRSDSKGIYVEISPPNTDTARNTLEEIRAGELDGFSFGMIVAEDHWSRKNGELVREVRRASLAEVTVTGFAAYPEATIALRSLEAHEQQSAMEHLRRMERELKLRERN